MLDSPETPPGRSLPFRILRPRSLLIRGTLLGAVCLALAGAGYGALLYSHPLVRDWEIQRRLSRPHPDSPRALAAIHAVRYENLWTLMWRRALGGVFLGATAGLFAGAAIDWLRRHWPRQSRAETSASVSSPSFSKWRPARVAVMLMAIWLIAGIVNRLVPPEGCVYYQGHDQFDWMEQLDRHNPDAVTALAELLRTQRPFPYERRLIETLGRAGPEALPALPVLWQLQGIADPELRIALEKAIRRIELPPNPNQSKKPRSGGWV